MKPHYHRLNTNPDVKIPHGINAFKSPQSASDPNFLSGHESSIDVWRDGHCGWAKHCGPDRDLRQIVVPAVITKFSNRRQKRAALRDWARAVRRAARSLSTRVKVISTQTGE